MVRERRTRHERYEGVFSPVSNVGLAALERRYPHRWHWLVADKTPKAVFTSRSTLAEVIKTNLFRQAQPLSAEDRKRVERPRRLGAHILAVGEAVHFRALDEETLASLHASLEARGLSDESARRAITIVRQLAVDWADARGTRPLLERRGPRGGSTKGSANRERRRSPTLTDVAGLLQRARPDLACYVALVVGAGLRRSEALRVELSDLASLPELTVRCPNDGSPARRVRIAEWAVGVLRANQASLGRLGSPFAFPHRLDPARTRLDFGARLRKAGVTSEGLRRLGCLVLRRAGLPRELVRASWAPYAYAGRPPWWSRYCLLQESWTALIHPPVSLPEDLTLPPRTSARGPLEPDIGTRAVGAAAIIPLGARTDAPGPPGQLFRFDSDVEPPAAEPGSRTAEGGLRQLEAWSPRGASRRGSAARRGLRGRLARAASADEGQATRGGGAAGSGASSRAVQTSQDLAEMVRTLERKVDELTERLSDSGRELQSLRSQMRSQRTRVVVRGPQPVEMFLAGAATGAATAAFIAEHGGVAEAAAGVLDHLGVGQVAEGFADAQLEEESTASALGGIDPSLLGYYRPALRGPGSG